MIKKHFKTSTIVFGIIISVFMIFTLFKCKPEPKAGAKGTKPITKVSKPIKINKINFYFENSGSMKGYLNGDNFQQTVHRILRNSENDNLNPYFVNTKQYFEPNIIGKIVKKDIKTLGIENSDHQFIFTNAIKNAVGNNLSIVVTDGIYSMKDGNIAIVEIDIEDAFTKALEANKNNIETVVLKMSSNFKGTYYTESKDCNNVTINQERPYYILLFGNKAVINKALKEIVVIKDLEGYKEQARFLITKDLAINYTVLTKGEEKKGNFKSKDFKPIVNEIVDAEKFSQKGVLLKDTYLQFAIAVDYSNLSIPDSYLTNKSNYSIVDNTDYEVVEIKLVDKLSKNSKSYLSIEKLNEKGNYKYTHLIVVKAKTKLYGDLKINLNMNFPQWISQTGTIDDCSIKNDSTTTFAFDRLMKGISIAYEKASTKKEYFEIKINIKAN